MQVWNCFLDNLEKQFGKETIGRWLRPLVVTRFDAANIFLQAKDSFQVMWFDEHIRPFIKKALVNNNGRPIKVHLSVGNSFPQEKIQGPAEITEKVLKYEQDELAPYCTFDQFIPSEENLVPFKVIQHTLEVHLQKGSESLLYNPIYLYGSSGVGKTHLLMALTKALLQKGVKAFFVNAQTFTEHVVSAIRRGDMHSFREAYRHLDVLIIDDIEILARKNATQEEFFHTFNTLHMAGKQIILSGPSSPNFLEGIEERLISRFEWGISLPLQKVTSHTDLLAGLQKRAEYFEVKLERSLQEYLVTFFKELRVLLKILDAIMVHLQINPTHKKEFLSLTHLKDFIDELRIKEMSQKITPEKIIGLVADLFDIKMDDIVGKSQSRDCALPRQIAMFLLRSELKMPYMKIGSLFSRDHSTVMTSIKSISLSLEGKDKQISFYLQDIQRKLLSCG